MFLSRRSAFHASPLVIHSENTHEDAFCLAATLSSEEHSTRERSRKQIRRPSVATDASSLVPQQHHIITRACSPITQGCGFIQQNNLRWSVMEFRTLRWTFSEDQVLRDQLGGSEDNLTASKGPFWFGCCCSFLCCSKAHAGLARPPAGLERPPEDWKDHQQDSNVQGNLKEALHTSVTGCQIQEESGFIWVLGVGHVPRDGRTRHDDL